MKITLNLNENVDLKIVTDGMVGTLHIRKTGIAFSPPKAKVFRRAISYEDLPQMITLFTQLRS